MWCIRKRAAKAGPYDYARIDEHADVMPMHSADGNLHRKYFQLTENR